MIESALPTDTVTKPLARIKPRTPFGDLYRSIKLYADSQTNQNRPIYPTLGSDPYRKPKRINPYGIFL